MWQVLTRSLRPHRWLPQTARILAATVLAYAAAAILGLPDRFWAMITAVIVTQPALAATLSAGRDRMVGTLVGAVVGLLVIAATLAGAPLMPTFWMALLPLAALTALRPDLRLSCVTLIVVVLIPSTGAPFARPLDRVLEIVLGSLASIVVSAGVFSGRDER